MPVPGFLHGVEANICFWLEQVEQVKNNQYTHLHPDRANMFQAVEIGLIFEETQKQALGLALNLFDLVEWGGFWQEWLPILAQGLTVKQATTPLQIRLLNQLGFLHMLLHELDLAMNYYQDAEIIAQETRDIYGLANTAFGLCNIYLQQLQLSQAEEQGLKALDLFTQAAAPQKKLIVTHHILGTLYTHTGKYELAAQYLSRAVELCTSVDDDILLARMKSELAEPLRILHKEEEALCHLQEALAFLEKGDSPNLRFRILNRIGILYFSQMDYPEAERHFLAIDPVFFQRQGNLYWVATRANNLGNVCMHTNRLDEARQYFDHAIELWRRIPNEIELGNTLGDLGETLEKQKQLLQALAAYEEAVQNLEKYPQHAWARKLHQRIQARIDHLSESLSNV